jgi:iron-sulfur cluster assembly accessory protein
MIAFRRLLVCALLASGVATAGCGVAQSQSGTEPDQTAIQTQPQSETDQSAIQASVPKEETQPSEAKPLIELTPAATKKILETVREGQADGSLPKVRLHLRVRLLAGGCCGFLHKLDLDPDVAPRDHAFSAGDLTVVVSRRQVDMLRGSRIDFIQSVKETGFTIKSPNFEGEALKKWLPLLESQQKAK